MLLTETNGRDMAQQVSRLPLPWRDGGRIGSKLATDEAIAASVASAVHRSLAGEGASLVLSVMFASFTNVFVCDGV